MNRSLLRVGGGAAALVIVLGVSVGASEPPQKKSCPQRPAAMGAPPNGATCPYLQQQAAKQRAVRSAEIEMGRDVMENLERLKAAEKLLKRAEELKEEGRYAEGVPYCCHARDLCPGSCCAERAAEMLRELEGLAFVRVFLEQSRDLREIEYEWERIWYTDMPKPLTVRKTAPNPSKKRERKHRTIAKALQIPVNLNLSNVPLRKVIDDLRTLTGINIYVDEPALAEKGISEDTPITLKLDDIALKSALNLLLKLAHLTYVVKDDVLQITTEEHAHGKLEQRCYPVADLLYHKDLPKRAGLRPEKNESREACLIRVITSTVNPQSWSDMGGPASIEFFPLTMSLVINQTPDNQDQIHDLLTALRRLYDSSESSEPPACPHCPGSAPEKKKKKALPSTLRSPPMPPVDADIVPALDRVLTAEMKDRLEVGVSAEGGLRLRGTVPCLGNVYHIQYGRGLMAIWKTPDAARTPR